MVGTPIAVVGLSCRFPGGANDPEKLWHMLSEGRDAWSDVPGDRFNSDSFYHPNPESHGTYNHRGGHFIDQDVAAFDSGFFGIAPFESAAIDPQSRIQLEVAYEALENAGIPIESVQGSDTAVYVAVFSQDYAAIQYKDLDDIPNYHATGTGIAITSNRLSYIFDLKGPSVTVDTGCSGSLVAVHQACQSLQSGECGMALAGGTNLILNPDFMIPLSHGHILNNDGRCYSFDTRGSGYGRGEGAAMVVLKRLDDAIQAGDHIRAVIRGTGVGQDGKTPGITVPSSDAQQSLIRSVYQHAGLNPIDTPYVEAHGTGTVVGDSQEFASIRSVFGGDNSHASPLYVGSIKPNIGHLESASGIAGLIKAVLMLEHDELPPNLNLEIPKQSLKLDTSRIIIPRKLEPWTKGALRRVSVNSFGYGGTNAHAILDSLTMLKTFGRETNGINGSHGTDIRTPAGSILEVNGNSPKEGVIVNEGRMQVLTISAKSEKSLRETLESLRAWVSTALDSGSIDIRDLAHTLVSRRSTMQWRWSFTAASLAGALSTLELKNAIKPTRSSNNNHTVFVFTGQGAQWFAMGKELMDIESPYRESLLKSAEMIRNLGAPWDLIEELSRPEPDSRINESEIAQPATTAIQIALVDLLQSIGVTANAVVGHSSGEIAAAYAAGALSHMSSVTVAYFRGLLKVNPSIRGAMMAVGLEEKQAAEFTSALRTGVAVVACANSPSSSTISGDESAISELKEILDKSSISARRLQVDTAWHSHHVAAIADKYLSDLKGLESGETLPSVKYISSVTGQQKRAGFGPDYWVENLVSKVRFRDALEELSRSQQAIVKSALLSPKKIFVEIGPHRALTGPITQTMLAHGSLPSRFCALPTLVRNHDAISTILDFAGKYFEQGCQVQLGSVNLLVSPIQPRKVVTSLPPYAWDHSTRYWHESRLSKAHRFRAHPYHDLLGVRIVSSTSLQPTWRHIISIDRLPWLQDHIIDGSMVFPGSGYICMAIEAARQISFVGEKAPFISKYLFKDVAFTSALTIPESPQHVEIQLCITGTGRPPLQTAFTWEEFRVSSVSVDGTSLEHCHGFIALETTSEVDEVEATRENQLWKAGQHSQLDQIKESNAESIDCVAWYEDMKLRGNFYGPSFSAVKTLSSNGRNTTGTVVIPNVEASMPGKFLQPHVIHPSTLDSLIHSSLPLFYGNSNVDGFMITGISELAITAGLTSMPGAPLNFHTTLTSEESATSTANITASQANNTPEMEFVLHIKEAQFRSVGMAGFRGNSGRDMGHQMRWDLDVDYATSSIFKLPDEIVVEGVVPQEQRIDILSQAAALYMRDCISEISANGLQVLPGNRRHHFDWMARFVRSDEYKNLISSISQSSTEELTLRNARKLGSEGEVICRIGENLAAIITGKVDPLSLMMEDNLLPTVYAEDTTTTRCHLQMIAYLRLLVFKHPNMRILEIGGGTGSATFPLLQALSSKGVLPLESYDFTDISNGFLERSRARLREWERYINYKTLDVREDPIEQGYNEGSYDLVIASNVIHVASSLDTALLRIKKLLKPGGRLIQIETTRVFPYYSACFGVLDGWWAGVDTGRPDGPTMGIDQWDAAFLRNGFNGAEIVAKDYEGSTHRAAMMATKSIDFGDLANGDRNIPSKIIVCPAWGPCNPEFAAELMRSVDKDDIEVSVAELPSEDIATKALYIILDDGSNPILRTGSPIMFKNIIKLLGDATRVLWVTAQYSSKDLSDAISAERGLITGFARVARAENDFLRLIMIDVQDDLACGYNDIVRTIGKLVFDGFYAPPPSRPQELEYLYKGGQLYVPRVIPDANINQRLHNAAGKPRVELQLFHQPNRPLKLQVEKYGFLDSLRFVDDDLLQESLPEFDVEVKVEAWGINFKDVLITLGRLENTIPMAGEYSGIVTKVGSKLGKRFQVGNRVCGFGGTPYASHVRVKGDIATRIPDSMSFVLGAAIPVVFSTAYHALVDIARLQPDQTVLIHSAAGGVGQAALRVAQHIGAKIFATVGNAYKRRLLIDEFGIPEDHIFSSKMRTFKQGIYRLTNGKGVDIVVNSLSGQALQDSWATIANFGVFVELGKTDRVSNNMLSMKPFDRNVTFASIDLGMMYQIRPKQFGDLLGRVILMFESGHYVPVKPITTMPITEIESAFRIMQTRQHTGKIVLEAKPGTMVQALPKTPDPLQLSGEGTYMIAGGLGYLGLELARFLVRRGAKYVALLSRRVLDPAKRQEYTQEFRELGADVRVFSCDITDLPKVQETISICSGEMPPIMGVIQATMVLADQVLRRMDLDRFQKAMLPKTLGTRHLIKALEGHPLDFFLMLSSISSVLGTLSQANYAAGNAFMDTLANNIKAGDTPCVSLNLSLFSEARDPTALVSSDRMQGIFARQGCIILDIPDLLPVIEYCISKECRKDQCKQVILGADYRSFAESDNKHSLINPMFSHILPIKGHGKLTANSTIVVSVEAEIASAESAEKVETIISGALARKISTLVAVNYEEIDFERSVSDFGLDSLVLIELKNWIMQTFQAKVQSSEISDSSHIVALASLVVARSGLVMKILPSNGEKSSHHGIDLESTQKDSSNANGVNGSTNTTLPKQPLPDLDKSLDQYLEAIRPIFTDDEYSETLKYVDEFRKPGGFGRELQGRISKMANDPTVENWQHELYVNGVYLKNRVPLLPWTNFFGSHLMTSWVHSPSERAAIISTAAFEFKRKLEVGEVDYEFINGQPLSKDYYKWFFNATREPRLGKDEMVKYAEDDYLVAFRRGHAFKIPLRNGKELVSYAMLKALFQAILDSKESPASWAGILTADDRDSWSTIRQSIMDISPSNSSWIRTIEASAFIIYLDDAQPSNALERGHQFLHANGFNRWCDKTIQFAICDNGVSASIGEHSMLDGYVFRRLSKFVSDAIMELEPSDPTSEDKILLSNGSTPKGYTFVTTPLIEQHIGRIRAEVVKNTSRYELAAFDITSIGSDFFRSYKCPPKSGVQLAIQLACRRHFGYNPAAFETVALNHFHKGRIDVNHVVWPSVARFCTMADKATPPTPDLRSLFFEAARTHAKNLTRASRGQGIDRHLLSLEWSVRRDEEVPALFTSPLYEGKSRPRRVMTDCLTSGCLEVGSLLPDPESLWIHFEPEENRVRFSIWGPTGQTANFRELIEKSAEDIRSILQS